MTKSKAKKPEKGTPKTKEQVHKKKVGCCKISGYKLPLLIALVVALTILVISVISEPSSSAPNVVCGDNLCSISESCTSCPEDCVCKNTEVTKPTEETPLEDTEELVEVPVVTPPVEETIDNEGTELATNIYDDAIGIETERQLKEEGYVIVRYFYNRGCISCTNPVNWVEVLKDLAEEMPNTVIVEIFNADEKKWAAERWASSGLGQGTYPLIRIEGMQNGQMSYRTYYSEGLAPLHVNTLENLKIEVCKYTENC